MNLEEALQATLAGHELNREETRDALRSALREDASPVALGGLLTALAVKGETPDQIAGGAEALRLEAVPFEHDYPDAIDTCGTGGDGLSMFNVSTASAIVAAAAGAKVVKHGNRSVSSKSGSADLLEAAGIELELSPAGAREVLDEVGITFLFAPRYHPAMRFAGPVRAALGVRTLFNFLGPLCNPGGVKRQLLGVSDPSRLDDYQSALSSLGCERGFVVHGAGGADELTLAGENQMRTVGDAPAFDVAGTGLAGHGIADLAGGDANENLAMLQALLGGQAGAVRDAVVLNSAAALVVAGTANDAAEAAARANEAIDSGAAKNTFERWIEASGKAAR